MSEIKLTRRCPYGEQAYLDGYAAGKRDAVPDGKVLVDKAERDLVMEYIKSAQEFHAEHLEKIKAGKVWVDRAALDNLRAEIERLRDWPGLAHTPDDLFSALDALERNTK